MTDVVKIDGRIEENLLSDFLRSLNESGSLQTTVSATARFATLLLGGSWGVVCLFDDITKQYKLAGSYCTSTSFAAADLYTDGTVIVALNEVDQPIEVEIDPATGQESFVHLSNVSGMEECRARLAPLKHDNDVLGLLVVAFERQTQEHTSREDLFDLLLQQSSIAIRKARDLEAQQRASDSLSTVAAVSSTLPRLSTFTEMLGHIMDNVTQLFDAEIGGVSLYYPETRELILQNPSFRASEEVIRKHRLPLSAGGVHVHVFQTGQPYLARPHDSLVLRRVADLVGHRDSITVPLEVNGRRIGVFTLSNKRGGSFSETDLRTLILCAPLLSVLVENAKLLEQQHASAARLQGLNRGLESGLSIHNELTRMVLDGRGIQAIVDSLSKVCANPVAVADRFAYLVAQSTLCGGVVDDNLAWLSEDKWQSTVVGSKTISTLPGLGRERRPVRVSIEDTGLPTRVVAPIVVGQETMGWVHVLEANRALDDVDLMAVEGAATAIALQMMAEKAAVEAQYKLRDDLVGELLSGSQGSVETTVERGVYLGLDLRVPRAVVVVDIDGLADLARSRGEDHVVVVKASLRAVAERALLRLVPGSIVSARGDEVVVLVKVERQNEHDLRSRLQGIGDALRAEVSSSMPEITVSVGIGSLCDSLAHYGESFRQARSALGVVKVLRRHSQTLAYGDLGIHGVLFDPHNREKLLAFMEKTIGSLLDYDRRHDARLTESLYQYLLHDCHLEQAALALHVHVNTLRYRLQRAKEITKSDLSGVETRSNLYLALKVAFGHGVK